MRGIVAREHRRAMAERRAAQACHADATRPAPSPRRLPGRIPRAPVVPDPKAEAARAARQRDIAAAYPAIAREQRGLRKARAEMLRRWDHKREGTPETHEHARRHASPLADLFRSGAIDAVQLGCAAEIAEAVAAIGADVSVATASFETRIDAGQRGDGTFYEALGRVRREIGYGRWREEVARLGPLGCALDMIVGTGIEVGGIGNGGGPIGYSIAAARHRIGARRAKKLLIDALDLWPRIMGHVAKEVTPADLAAAHAGLL